MKKIFVTPVLIFLVIFLVNAQTVTAQLPSVSIGNGWVDNGNTVRLRTDSDSVGIGTRNPTQKVEINGGLRLNTADTQPVCDDNARGTQWFRQESTGDSLEVCKFVGVPFATLQGAQLPSKRSGLSCAQDSSSYRQYCFGGAYYDTSVEYNPKNDSIASKNGRLPTARAFLSCSEDTSSNKIYCFGGSTGGYGYGEVGLNDIVEYNPLTDSATTKTAILPSPRLGLSCAQDSSTNKIYCFGGLATNGVHLDEILEYDPSGDNIIVKAAKLPTGRYGLSCAEDTSTHKIYCFGGDVNYGSQGYQSDILEYDPLADVLIVKTRSLPEAVVYSSCAFSANNFYCVGGRMPGSINSNQIVRYDPAADTTSISSFPKEFDQSSCSQDSSSGKIYCFGGEEFNESAFSSDIFEVNPVGLQWVPID